MIPGDTIAAIATAPGEGSLAVVRLSGPESLCLADQAFNGGGKKTSTQSGGTFLHGYIVDQQGNHIDEGIALIFKKPNSYTCEDIVEFQIHGGNQCARRVVRRLFELGARPAEPGEFTKRAFLNGRMDLIQAEAVLDLIHAQTERASIAALDQLEGTLSNQCNSIYDEILNQTSILEALLDFPEDEIPEQDITDINNNLLLSYNHIKSIIHTWEEGCLLRDGARVVISGKPNVGKSTLLNALLESDRAIVSAKPGTTRDVIEEKIIIKGIPIRLFDTAGLRNTECDIEQEGINRAFRAREKGDFHLYVVDSSQETDKEIHQHLNALRPQHCLIIKNKIDLGMNIDLSAFPSFQTIETNLLKGIGFEHIIEKIASYLEQRIDLSSHAHAVISERHRLLLMEAGRALEQSISTLNYKEESLWVFVISNLRLALEKLGELTGKVYGEELLDNIFSRFCIGK